MAGDTSFFELTSKGIWVMITIGLCSVVGLAIIIYLARQAGAMNFIFTTANDDVS